VNSLAGKRALVTGGAGFIGSHLADYLVADGAVVTILDDFSNGLESNLVGLASTARVLRGSICDPTALARAMEGVEFVFHLAAMGSVPRSIEMPERYEEVNVTGTMRVLQAARTAGVVASFTRRVPALTGIARRFRSRKLCGPTHYRPMRSRSLPAST